MPTIQKDRIGQPIGFINHQTKEPITINQSIDITDQCLPEKINYKKIIIDYAQSTSRKIIAITKMNQSEEIDVVIYFFLVAIENISCFPDFFNWAENVGLKMEVLKKIIMENAPVEPVTVE